MQIHVNVVNIIFIKLADNCLSANFLIYSLFMVCHFL